MSSPEDSHILTPGDRSNENDGDGDDVYLTKWASFLKQYARGDCAANPVRPPLTSDQLKRLETVTAANQAAHFEDHPLYSSTTVTRELARSIRDFYCDNGYLPPPRAPWEESRERCIQEYDLYSKTQSEYIQSVTDVLAVYFPDALVTFSLFQDRIQTHFALSGPKEIIDEYQLHVGLRIPAEDSLCGHAVLLDRAKLFIPDLQADWRYKLNPFGVAGFKSFVGVPVALELNPLQDDAPSADCSGTRGGRIVIGTLNICFVKEKVSNLSPGQQLVIDRMAAMLEIQLRATWEGDRRRRDARARNELSNYIEEAMIGETSKIPGGRRGSVKTDNDSHREVFMSSLIESLVGKVKTIISEADTVDVFDIRAVSLQT
jgi:hypothetical protein